MKKKLLVAALAVIMVVTAIAGTSLAYLTDTDSEDNVFTFGNVAIDLQENYDQNSKLIPGVDINKDVWVMNTGSEDAYVRVHIAIPAILDDGDPTFNAGNNVLHVNFSRDSVADGEWSWNKTVGGSNYPGNGGDFNFYTATLPDGIKYNVYVVTYKTALTSQAGTLTYALDKVYIDTKVTNEDITSIKATLGDTPLIKVFAEGCQTATFTDAFDALNTAFGTPGSEGYVAPWNR
jgi:predicted ribosomally synthesized peptide with SipW-like signal peptide